MAKEIELHLGEILLLGLELNGIQNQATGEKLQKGLLDYTMKLKTRYNLSKILPQIENVEKMRQNESNRIISILEPTPKSGIPRFEKDNEGKDTTTPHPLFISYLKQMDEFLELKEKLIIPETLTLEELLDIECSENIKILFKLFDQEELLPIKREPEAGC